MRIDASATAITWLPFAALDRLYFGLTVMTVMLAVVIGTVGLSHAVN